MSGHEGFLERWSRRKREAASEPDSRPDDEESKKNEAAAAAPAERRGSPETRDTPAGKPFDVVDLDLPSIDSIDANTDVCAFLQPGVPAELTRAALRRAWSADPAIRDFVGLVENGWDFNNPVGIPGFGPISAGDVARLLSQLVGELPAETAPPPADPPQVPALRGDQEPNLPSQRASSEPPAQLAQDEPASKQDAAGPNPTDVRRSKDGAASQNGPGNEGDLANDMSSRP